MIRRRLCRATIIGGLLLAAAPGAALAAGTRLDTGIPKSLLDDTTDANPAAAPGAAPTDPGAAKPPASQYLVPMPSAAPDAGQDIFTRAPHPPSH